MVYKEPSPLQENEEPMPLLVYIADLGKDLNLDRSAFRKWVRKRGFTIHRATGLDAQGHLQVMSAITAADAERIKQERQPGRIVG